MSDVVQHDPQAQKFFVAVGRDEAHVEYERPDGRTIDLHHTFVPASARGRGLAEVLVRAALDHARAERLCVVPTCSYVRRYLATHEEYADLTKGG